MLSNIGQQVIWGCLLTGSCGFLLGHSSYCFTVCFIKCESIIGGKSWVSLMFPPTAARVNQPLRLIAEEDGACVWKCDKQTRKTRLFLYKNNVFLDICFQNQTEVKELDPDRRDAEIQQQKSDQSYTRGFSRVCYEKWSWLAWCGVSNVFYCFSVDVWHQPLLIKTRKSIFLTYKCSIWIQLFWQYLHLYHTLNTGSYCKATLVSVHRMWIPQTSTGVQYKLCFTCSALRSLKSAKLSELFVCVGVCVWSRGARYSFPPNRVVFESVRREGIPRSSHVG